jgi:hypothetical protein
VAQTTDEVAATSGEGEDAKDEESPSITELLVQLGRDVSVLVFCETQLAPRATCPRSGGCRVISPVPSSPRSPS